MKRRTLLSLILLLGVFSMVSVSCKKSVMNNLEGSWAMVPIANAEMIGDDGEPQNGWEVWEFTGGTVTMAPNGNLKRYTCAYKVADLFVETRLILSEMTKDGIPIESTNDKAYEAYNTTWTIVKLNNQRLVIFSQKSGGIQREFLRL